MITPTPLHAMQLLADEPQMREECLRGTKILPQKIVAISCIKPEKSCSLKHCSVDSEQEEKTSQSSRHTDRKSGRSRLVDGAVCPYWSAMVPSLTEQCVDTILEGRFYNATLRYNGCYIPGRCHIKSGVKDGNIVWRYMHTLQ
jgi:hypothetical protein